MTSALDTSPTARKTPEPRVGRLVLITTLCAIGVVAVVSGGYAVNALHVEKAEVRVRDQATIRTERRAVIAQAKRHTIYAPAGWGALEYPSAQRTKVSSFGKYGALNVHLWQRPGHDILGSKGPRDIWSMATPTSLCEFTARDRRADPLLNVQEKTMRCTPVPGSRAQIRTLPDYPKPGDTDVRLAMALPEKGRYLNVWAIDETGEIAEDPVAWAASFIADLEPYDVTGYSVEDIYQARDAGGWYGE